MQTTDLTVNGMKVAVHASAGAGPGALFIHGNSSSGASFEKQLSSELGYRRRLTAVDLPGHGRSDDALNPEDTYTIPGFAAVVAEVARQTGHDSSVLVGWSLGGHIALEATTLLPDLAGVMILGAPPLAFPPDMEAAFLPDPANGILFQETLNEEEVAVRVAGLSAPGSYMPPLFADDIRRSDGRFRSNLLGSIGTVGFTDEVNIVRNLDIPLAVLHGSEERVVSGDYIESIPMPTLWRGAIQHVRGSGHSPFWEEADAFDDLLAAFLADTLG